MMGNDCSGFPNPFGTPAESSSEPVTVRTETVADASDAETVTDRQERIEGFDQSVLEETSVLLVGAGGLGGQIAESLVRKGIGELFICDEDHVAVSNLSRQPFYADDVGRNKAAALTENLEREGTCGTEIVAYPWHFQDVLARGYEVDVDIVVCAPDNDEARIAVANQFLTSTPAVFTGLGLEAASGYVYVQEPGEPCFGCFRPEAGGGAPCPGTPAVVDPAKAIAGIALYAVDTVVMDRYRDWDVYEVFLTGRPGPVARDVEFSERCPVCDGDAEDRDAGGGR
jgi:adenylyltransferase/sulfurtransferase